MTIKKIWFDNNRIYGKTDDGRVFESRMRKEIQNVAKELEMASA